jgi:hypothetical protein
MVIRTSLARSIENRRAGVEADMNLYRIIGDRIGTPEARALSQELVIWHDAMVKHLRSGAAGTACLAGCAHEEARALWSSALEIFGEHAGGLLFLRAHGGGHSSAGPPRTFAASLRG